MDYYNEYIHLSRYSRWIEENKSRELSWPITVDRYCTFFEEHLNDNKEAIKYLRTIAQPAIERMDVVPSMRCLMTAGKALARDHCAAFNCSYIAMDHVSAFDEILYILMCGTGVGFSVERQYIQKLPGVPENLYETDTTIYVRDSKIGWAVALKELLAFLYNGQIPKWNLDKIRPKGARLKTFGGRASGPEPLDALLHFVVQVFSKTHYVKGCKRIEGLGRPLTSLEVHDIVCKIADVVIVGGVRRSALISLSNLTDERMRKAKSGDWYTYHPQRALANNSVCYTEQPDIGIFMKEWLSLYESKSGERGIFNRAAAIRNIPERRKDLGYTDFGCNPCSEVILRSGQFCNLSEEIIRPGDTVGRIIEKVRIATFLGKIQSTLTNFRYLRKVWERNTKEEGLLGVSLTGIMDNKLMSNPDPKMLEALKNHAIKTDEEWSTRLGITPSSAITCVKPSGTVSQLVGCSSGIHAAYSKYWIRRVASDKKDPLMRLMLDQGVPNEPHYSKPDDMLCFKFPMSASKDSVVVSQRNAIQQLETWKLYAKHWAEHKPSVTIYVKEAEWFDVGAWCYNNFDILSGVSFFPVDDFSYPQPVLEEVNEETYNKLKSQMPKKLDWSKLSDYEIEDTTETTKELACSAGACEL